MQQYKSSERVNGSVSALPITAGSNAPLWQLPRLPLFIPTTRIPIHIQFDSKQPYLLFTYTPLLCMLPKLHFHLSSFRAPVPTPAPAPAPYFLTGYFFQ